MHRAPGTQSSLFTERVQTPAGKESNHYKSKLESAPHSRNPSKLAIPKQLLSSTLGENLTAKNPAHYSAQTGTPRQ
ncbi:hypothetical protein IscW_ISCW001796 [Ixodes scapularis]|uniref:Uncharacterized protein n=1 Tax=Ixodes scapularis TaxID=6945 RepID=B7P143_IXOSC|nr:hypothetical protein IscW_ISCW001796 [Ixodes scapularis]|eukprot:XP_002400162.1 hypothetical protein IscW_ISCW001796 [Ixodes scapularis]